MKDNFTIKKLRKKYLLPFIFFSGKPQKITETNISNFSDYVEKYKTNNFETYTVVDVISKICDLK